MLFKKLLSIGLTAALSVAYLPTVNQPTQIKTANDLVAHAADLNENIEIENVKTYTCEGCGKQLTEDEVCMTQLGMVLCSSCRVSGMGGTLPPSAHYKQNAYFTDTVKAIDDNSITFTKNGKYYFSSAFKELKDIKKGDNIEINFDYEFNAFRKIYQINSVVPQNLTSTTTLPVGSITKTTATTAIGVSTNPDSQNTETISDSFEYVDKNFIYTGSGKKYPISRSEISPKMLKLLTSMSYGDSFELKCTFRDDTIIWIDSIKVYPFETTTTTNDNPVTTTTTSCVTSDAHTPYKKTITGTFDSLDEDAICLENGSRYPFNKYSITSSALAILNALEKGDHIYISCTITEGYSALITSIEEIQITPDFSTISTTTTVTTSPDNVRGLISAFLRADDKKLYLVNCEGFEYDPKLTSVVKSLKQDDIVSINLSNKDIVTKIEVISSRDNPGTTYGGPITTTTTLTTSSAQKRTLGGVFDHADAKKLYFVNNEGYKYDPKLASVVKSLTKGNIINITLSSENIITKIEIVSAGTTTINIYTSTVTTYTSIATTTEEPEYWMPAGTGVDEFQDVVSYPTKTVYEKGEELDFDGLTVHVVHAYNVRSNKGRFERRSSDYDVEIANIDADDYTIKDKNNNVYSSDQFSSLPCGTYIIDISRDIKCTHKNANPNSWEYLFGIYDLSFDVTIKDTYAITTSVTTQPIVTDTKPNVHTPTYTVTMSPVYKLDTVNSYPTKTVYTEGEELDFTGLSYSYTISTRWFGEPDGGGIFNSSRTVYEPDVSLNNVELEDEYNNFYKGTEFTALPAGKYTVILITDKLQRSYGSNEIIYDIVINKAVPTGKISGDANFDGGLDMADVVLIMQALANPDKYGIKGTDKNHITEQGSILADMDGNGLTTNDALKIQRILLGLDPMPES